MQTNGGISHIKRSQSLRHINNSLLIGHHFPQPTFGNLHYHHYKLYCENKKETNFLIFSSNFFWDLKNVGGGGNYLKIFLNLESCPINLAIFLFSLHLFVLDHHLIQNLFPPLHLPEDVKNFS